MGKLDYDVGDPSDAQVLIKNLRQELFPEQVDESTIFRIGVMNADGFADVGISHVQLIQRGQ